MKRLSSVAGDLWALISIVVAVVLFSSIGGWEKKLITIGSISTAPKFTGGEVVATEKRGSYVTEVHRAVFDGILGDTRTGFVQIDWKEAGARLPDSILEDVDYDRDGKIDFRVTLDTRKNTARLTSFCPQAIAILDRSSLADFVLRGYPDARFGVFVFKGGRTVRVLLKKP